MFMKLICNFYVNRIFIDLDKANSGIQKLLKAVLSETFNDLKNYEA